MRVSPELRHCRTKTALAVTCTLILLFLTGCALQSRSGAQILPAGYPNDHLLVSAGWLADRLEEPDIRIVDLRPMEDYQDGHIPGAVHVAISDITETVDGVPFEVDLDEVSQTLDRIGLTSSMTVVIYDNLGMMSSARFFWTLEYLGHPDARILHGGWNQWQAGGHPADQHTPSITPTNYPLNPDSSRLVTADQVLADLDHPDVAILDARSPQEYSGEIVYAEQGGHIPGAVNLPWRTALTGGDTVSTTDDAWQQELRDPDVEHFKPPEEISAILPELSHDQRIITYCQTH